jgi:hypothetical protein
VLPGELLHLVLHLDPIPEPAIGGPGAQRVLFREEVRIGGMRAVGHRGPSHDDLADAGLADRVQDVHRADHLELVRESMIVARVREEGGMDDRLDALLLQDPGQRGVRRGLGEIDPVELHALVVDGGLLHVRDDDRPLGIALQDPAQQVQPEESRSAGDRGSAPSRFVVPAAGRIASRRLRAA